MALRPRTRTRIIRGVAYAVFVLVVLVAWIRVDWEAVGRAFFNPDIFLRQFPEVITVGAKNTLIFTLAGYVGGMIGGLILALMRLSEARLFRWVAAVYIDIFRGLPMLLTILIIGLGFPIALGPFPGGRAAAGMTALAVVAAAYLAEIIRAGIEAVPRGQMEAARSLGMSYGPAMVTLVVPQAFRIIIPPLTNEFILLLKDSSLLAVLGVARPDRELTKFARDAVLETFNATPFMAAGFAYLIITIPATRAVGLIERQTRRARV
jgi:polar amino acid transport system permease protein